MISYGICLFLSDLLHLVWQFLGPSTLLQMAIFHSILWGASLVAQMVENLPAVWETRVWSLCWEEPLEKEMATHSIFMPGESHDRGAWQATVHGVTESQTRLKRLGTVHGWVVSTALILNVPLWPWCPDFPLWHLVFWVLHFLLWSVFSFCSIFTYCHSIISQVSDLGCKLCSNWFSN